jgi:Arc/MetJ family transcription regulator
MKGMQMVKRMTVELDEQLLEEAKQVSGLPTARATIEEALRAMTTRAKREHEDFAERQRRFLHSLGEHEDLDVLASDEMWR